MGHVPQCPIQNFKNGVYDQEIPESQTTDKPITPRGRATKF